MQIRVLGCVSAWLATLSFLLAVADGVGLYEEQNKKCFDYDNSTFYQPVLNICLSCSSFCKDSTEAFCQPCTRTTTTSTSVQKPAGDMPADDHAPHQGGPDTAMPTGTGVPLMIGLCLCVTAIGVVSLFALGAGVRRRRRSLDQNDTANGEATEPDESVKCLQRIEAGVQDTQPAPSNHPMIPECILNERLAIIDIE